MAKKAKKKKRETRLDGFDTAVERGGRVWKYIRLDGMPAGLAWKKAYPFSKAKKKNWPALANRACQRYLKETKDDIDKLLYDAGFGLPRVVEELHRGLTRKKCIVHKGVVSKDGTGKNAKPILLEDNTNQQKMAEALIEIHGLKKRIVEHSGRGGGPIPIGVVELPMKMSPEEWNKEHGTGDTESVDTSAEAEDRS